MSARLQDCKPILLHVSTWVAKASLPKSVDITCQTCSQGGGHRRRKASQVVERKVWRGREAGKGTEHREHDWKSKARRYIKRGLGKIKRGGTDSKGTKISGQEDTESKTLRIEREECKKGAIQK
jgi:hypothetical protein